MPSLKDFWKSKQRGLNITSLNSNTKSHGIPSWLNDVLLQKRDSPLKTSTVRITLYGIVGKLIYEVEMIRDVYRGE